MTRICKQCLVLVVCSLAIGQVQAQVNPPLSPVKPGNDRELSPRPIRRTVSQPIRPDQQVMPQQRDYAWYVNRLQKRGGVQAATTMVRKPMAIANSTQMPASRSFDWYRQNLKRNPHLQQPTPASSRAAATAVMPSQRSYEWYQQQLNASRQRAHLTTLPGNRD